MPETTRIALKLTALDGTTETRYLEIKPDPRIYILGKIETENVNGEHISNITIYKLGETREQVANIETEKDGTFKILMYTPKEDDAGILNERYELVVSKAGYLDYTITEITLMENTELNIGEYKLIGRRCSYIRRNKYRRFSLH